MISVLHMYDYILCSVQSKSRHNSRIDLRKVGIYTLLDKVRIPTQHGSIPELSLLSRNRDKFLSFSDRYIIDVGPSVQREIDIWTIFFFFFFFF